MNVRNKYGSSSASTIAVLLLSRIVRGVGLDAYWQTLQLRYLLKLTLLLFDCVVY